MPGATQPIENATAPPSQVTAAAVAEPPLLEPAFSVTIDAPAQFRGIVFHPDGTKAFVHVSDPAIDLWPLAVYYWPEILGGLAVLLTLPALIVMVRRLRRPLRTGRLHCRKCGYDLGAAPMVPAAPEHPAAIPVILPRCPECGLETSKRPPRTHARQLRRVAVPLACVLAIAAVCSGLLLWGPERDGAFSTRFSWASARATAFSGLLGREKVRRWSAAIDRVRTLDCRAGRWAGILASHRGPTLLAAILSDDASEVYLIPGRESPFHAVEVDTGAKRRLSGPPPELTGVPKLARYPIPEWLSLARASVFRAGGATDSRRRWSRDMTEAAPASAWRLFRNNDWMGNPYDWAGRLPAPGGGRWVVFSHHARHPDTMQGRVEVHGPDGRTLGRFALGDPNVPCYFGILGLPHPRLVLGSPAAPGLRLYSLPDGAELPPIELPEIDSAGHEVLASPRGSRILHVATNHDALIYDAASERWIGTLRAPPSSRQPWYALSADGRFAAAAIERVPKAVLPGVEQEYITELVVWDLDRAPGAPGSGGGGNP